MRDPLEGRLLDGRYSVRSRVARGGMATVYLAVDRRLGREVALKVMHHHLTDDESFTDRFVREARSAARLSHPNVVQVFDQGSDGDLLYLAMEYLPGRTLREVLVERGVLTPREALTVLDPILDALSAAHRAGIVHRDIKPENVILTDDGRVKVTDFGLARGATPSAATTGQLMGTVAYLSPELVTRGVADARSDVYASGIMLFEMLTGCQPFTGGVPIQVAYRHVHEQVPAPSRLVPQLPVQLDDLVLSAAANDPDRRPDSAGELLALVRQVHQSLPDQLLDARPDRPDPSGVTPAPPTDPADDNGTQALPGLAGRQTTRALPGITPVTDHSPRPRPESPEGPGTAEDLGEASADVNPASTTPRERHRGTVALTALIMLVVLLGGGTAWWFVSGPGAYQETPRLTTLTVAEARAMLHREGLHADVVTRHDDHAQPGTVLATAPRPGEPVRHGGKVELQVCDGPARVTVPQVVKLAENTAKTRLEAGFLQVSGDRLLEYDDDAPPGTVLTANPVPGTEVDNGTAVTLTISRGPQPIDLPDTSGRSQQEAITMLQGLGFKPAVKQTFSDEVPAGTVISQNPPGGEDTQASHGRTVTLTVSLGPQTIPVPNVFGKRVNEATTILTEAGFNVTVKRILGGVFGTVRSQSPTPGSLYPKGTRVTVTVV